jgi:hypothetical protein
MTTMDAMFDRPDSWVIAVGFAVAMSVAWPMGWLRGRRLPEEDGDDPGAKFIDASMALLGLLLAFTFSIALGRHDQRRLAVVSESNALGDLYTCASLLAPPERERLQRAVRDYAEEQLARPHKQSTPTLARDSARRTAALQADMIHIAADAIAAGSPIAGPLTGALNEVSAATAHRVAAYNARLPWSIAALLLLGSLVPAFLVGEKQGNSHKVHASGSMSFIVLISLAIFVTFDLNQPHRGLIRIDQSSLEEAIQGMSASR